VKKLFFLCVVLIAYFTLYPWRMIPAGEPIVMLRGFEPFIGKSAYLDVVVNLFFYLPLGLLGALAWWGGEGTWRRVVALGAGGAALSAVLEYMQAWIPGRDSSIQDVLVNAIGMVAGAAIGVAKPRALPIDAAWTIPSSRRPAPLVLAAAWLVSQGFPFLPILRILDFKESLALLVQTLPLRWLSLTETFVACLLLSRLLRASVGGGLWRAGLVAAGLVIPARLLLSVGAESWLISVAAIAGLLLSARVLSRVGGEVRWLAGLALVLLAVKQSYPFWFASVPAPFHWVPFTGFLGAARDGAIRVTAGKFFLYGATVWMVREAGLSRWRSTAVVTGLLLAGEIAQRYLPGRISESTDPLLAVLAGLMLVWLGDRRADAPYDQPEGER
jgi:VanZ family protein